MGDACVCYQQFQVLGLSLKQLKPYLENSWFDLSERERYWILCVSIQEIISFKQQLSGLIYFLFVNVI